MDELISVGITHGDVNGIGYEVIIKSLLDNRINELCNPVVYGSAKLLAYHRKVLNINNFSLLAIRPSEVANTKKGCIVNCTDDNVKVELGKSTETAGRSALDALEQASADLLAGYIDVMVTAPINKQNIQGADFNFPGHTEYLNEKFNKGGDSLMLMIGETMRVGVVTGHVPIQKVPGLITEDLIMSKLRILNRSLLMDFGIRKPRIAVLGLNPHAGDNGLIGSEDIEIIRPTLEKARHEGIMAVGPYPADGFFGSGNYRKFDGILAMYHDQGLIPFKALVFEGGVNYTAGLPIVRTSPAHGTAYELAGKGVASEQSMREAIYLACDIIRNRRQFLELEANALK